MIEAPSVSLVDIIEDEVARFVAERQSGFDKKQLEFRIWATPALMRIHEVQMKYLQDVDIETPIKGFIKKRLQEVLNRLAAPNGMPTVLAVPVKGGGGRNWTWYPTTALTRPLFEALRDRIKAQRDTLDVQVKIADKLIAAMEVFGENATVADVYDTALTADEKRTFSKVRGLAVLQERDEEATE